jgi:hypothetical protein
MVAWDTICKPTQFGGLRVKDLRLQGLALRARWCWLRRTDPSRPWQGLPAIKDPEANEVFQSLAQFAVGEGDRILFWRDKWINGRNVEEIAPDVAALVPTRRKNMRMVKEALLEDVWLLDVAGELSIDEWMQCTLLWEELRRVPRDGDRPDQITWKGSVSRKYSTRRTYNMLCIGRITWSMAKPIWRSFAPLKCKIFGWLALKRRLWT